MGCTETAINVTVGIFCIKLVFENISNRCCWANKPPAGAALYKSRVGVCSPLTIVCIPVTAPMDGLPGSEVLLVARGKGMRGSGGGWALQTSQPHPYEEQDQMPQTPKPRA